MGDDRVDKRFEAVAAMTLLSAVPADWTCAERSVWKSISVSWCATRIQKPKTPARRGFFRVPWLELRPPSTAVIGAPGISLKHRRTSRSDPILVEVNIPEKWVDYASEHLSLGSPELEFGCRARPTKQKSLRMRTAGGDRERQLVVGFNALGDSSYPKTSPKVCHRGHD